MGAGKSSRALIKSYNGRVQAQPAMREEFDKLRSAGKLAVATADDFSQGCLLEGNSTLSSKEIKVTHTKGTD